MRRFVRVGCSVMVTLNEVRQAGRVLTASAVYYQEQKILSATEVIKKTDRRINVKFQNPNSK